MKKTLTVKQLQARLHAALEWCRCRGIVYCDDSAARILAGRISKGLQGKTKKFVHSKVMDELTKHEVKESISVLERELKTVTRRHHE